ncbi:taste receptor type 2 member 9 [Mustela nigripes]|uniref:Taste receptor type 2 n=1 Tax=Mustela putorius furo TaxID=9669 RepID=A0A8U0MUZ8_MUSPF|nr:taste receptor type 2 member 9 [Mustela putorius furo]XP_059260456.1 taste receptor type 2 member 9 [Mustela nigripes]
MLSTMEVIYTILIAGELTIGVWGNGFIVLVNCTGWIKRRDISMIDVILVSLAFSRICLLCVISLDGLLICISPDTYANSKLTSIVDVFWTLSNHSSVWFTSCLSIFYLLKIVNISHPLFLWLKLKINRIILGIFLMSFLSCIIISVSMNEDFWDPFEVNHKENTTWELKVSKIPSAFKLLFLNLGVIIPFVLCLTSFLLLLFSLIRHTKQRKLYATGSRDPSTEAHMRAIKALIIFLLLFLMYYAVFIILTSSLLIPQGELVVMFGSAIAVIFPSSHSFILIMGNSKLRKAFLKVLRVVKSLHRGRKPFVLQRILNTRGKKSTKDPLPSPN